MSTEKCIQEEKALSSLEPTAVNSTILQDFMDRGTAEEISAFVTTYMERIREGLISEAFRGYVILNCRFTAMNYLDSLGADSRECWEHMVRTAGMPSVRHGVRSTENVKEYLEKLMTLILKARDQVRDSQGKKILKKALEYIEHNYKMEELSLNMVAAAADLSPNYFSALFSQEMNITFIEYVTEKRMDRAKYLLRETKMRSSEIAPEIGYHDPHYFSYVFKKTQGCTPREYRHSDHTGEKI